MKLFPTFQLQLKKTASHSTLKGFCITLTLILLMSLVFLYPHLNKPHFLFASTTVEQLQSEIDELEKLKKMSEDATGNLEQSVKDLSSRINHAQAGITQAKTQSQELAKSIEEREDTLALQYTILTQRVAVHYKRLRSFNPIMVIFSNNDLSNLTKDLTYNSRVQSQDTQLIDEIAADIFQLEEDKKTLEQRQIQLASLQEQLDEQKKFFEKEIAGARQYQTELNTKIAELSARQQEIIQSRSGGFTVHGDSELADDPLASIQGFREGAPIGYFAVFSFGAYSHRNGMSQYGALGRAREGQDAEQILEAYYPGSSIQRDYSSMSNIIVDGYGSGSFEDWYLHRIYEVPSSWPKEVLKAQAIAARTYAIRYTNNGSKSICTTETCQVFKPEPKGGAWAEAIQETRGMVLVGADGELAQTQYASTHGGWSRTSGWDTIDGSGGSNFLEKAYESIGGSPWLYKAWWRKGYSREGDTCGKSNPWLSAEEMADIVNAYLILKKGSSSELERITPASSCWGGNPYSHTELREIASEYGGLSGATSVSVSQGNGYTKTVNINGISMSGDEFCRAFNLRAPGYLRIPQWSGSSCEGAFFNIEHKK